MSAAKRASIGAIAVLLLGLLFPSTTASAGSNCYTYSDAEKSFAYKMNRARRRAGRAPLRLDVHLGKASIVHTREMVDRNYLYHTPTTALSRRVTRWILLGENVGVGGGVDSLHKAFMNSPAHRANILYSTFKYVGIGVKKANGRMWVTVIFEAANDPGTPLC